MLTTTTGKRIGSKYGKDAAKRRPGCVNTIAYERGSRIRTIDKDKFDENFDDIDWSKKGKR